MHFSTQELLEQHVDFCAPAHGYIARFGTDISAVGRRFQCDPVSGLALLRPEYMHICPWCMTNFRAPEEARQHRQSCAMRQLYQAQYEQSQTTSEASSRPVVTHPASQRGDLRPLLPRRTDEPPHAAYARSETAFNNEVPPTRPRNLHQRSSSVLERQVDEGLKSPYFSSSTDEESLMRRINEPPSSSVTSFLIEIARNNAEARAIPSAPVGERFLPVVKPDPQPTYNSAKLPRLQPHSKSSASLHRFMAQPEAVSKARKPARAKFAMCEGCDRYCRHTGKDATRRC